MASGGVWGIDIGQCALKAIRCRAHDDDGKVVADAFDYIEYPKILSQPGSDPNELIGDALKQFLSRNTVVGDRVAVSVSGQAGLARFIKLPPVEAKKIPDIVRYEAKQQIPFDLNDVIWDYQRMGGGSEEEGFALETEVGLFAMKRDAVFRALAPFLKADIEVDIVQLSPEVLYNYLVFDQLGDLPSPEEYDPESPPDSMVIISLGTDATDLVISNGFRVWQRPIPIGGSHFTKALTKELKLTFAKAEHLKRNATAASDAKAVFQAMKPVFNDLLTELQRSFSFFSNLDRSAKIGRVIALGNAAKLPGLRRFLSQQLGFEIEKIEAFRTLTGSTVVSAPSFQENLLSFPVAYGLALQGLNKGAMRTNLLPREIIYDRLVKRKKPWALAAASMLLLGCSISYAAYSLAMGTVDTSHWQTAENEASTLVKQAGSFKSDADKAVADFTETDKIGQNLVGNVEGRIRWLELLSALNASLPSDPPAKADDAQEEKKDPEALAKQISQKKELHVTSLECQQVEDVSTWYTGVKHWDNAAPDAASHAGADASGTAAPVAGAGAAPGGAPAGGVAGGPAGAPGGMTGGPGAMSTGTPSAGGDTAGGSGEVGPKGPGWIIQLTGYHYHNADKKDYGAQYVRNTLIEKLRKGKIKLPSADPKRQETVSMADLGVSYPVLVNPARIVNVELPNPNAVPDATGPAVMGGGLGAAGGRARTPAGAGNDASAGTISLKKFDFVVQFCWQPKTPTMRQEAQKAKKAKDELEKKQAGATEQP